MFPSFEVFGRTIYTYSLCALLGLAACTFLTTKLVKSKGLKFDDVILVMLAIAAGMFLGGHILYGITNTGKIIDLFSDIGNYDFITFVSTLFGDYMGGMVFYGGFLGGLAGLAIFCRFSKVVRISYMLDIYAVCVPLFHVFGRIGCFLAGCCYGVESTWGFTAHGNLQSPEVNDIQRMPVQLIEAGCNLCIFLILFVLYRKGRLKNKLLFVYMLIYPVVRFILEFYRGDDIRGFIFGISTSQFISIILFAIACVYFIISAAKSRHIRNGAR